jgi:polynucleotide 5'-kinase involved in rRNA processing
VSPASFTDLSCSCVSAAKEAHVFAADIIVASQNESHVLVPDIIVVSRPGVIVFMSREVHPHPWDKLIYSSEQWCSSRVPQFCSIASSRNENRRLRNSKRLSGPLVERVTSATTKRILCVGPVPGAQFEDTASVTGLEGNH